MCPNGLILLTIPRWRGSAAVVGESKTDTTKAVAEDMSHVNVTTLEDAVFFASRRGRVEEAVLLPPDSIEHRDMAVVYRPGLGKGKGP